MSSIGGSYAAFKNSEFANFFNTIEVERTPMGSDGNMIVNLKPGGFQEFIDIKLLIDSGEVMKDALLYVARRWIGDDSHINPFAKDIVKSFIAEFIPLADFDHVKGLIDQIWQAQGTKDAVIHLKEKMNTIELKETGFKAFIGNNREYYEEFSVSCIKMENIILNSQEWFVTKISMV